MTKLISDRKISFFDIIIYVPSFSMILSFFYYLKLEIISHPPNGNMFFRLAEFEDMIAFGFFLALYASLISLAVTLTLSTITTFRLLTSFWRFWALHAVVNFLLCSMIPSDFKDASLEDLIIFAAPFFVSPIVSCIFTRIVTDVGQRFISLLNRQTSVTFKGKRSE